VNEVGQLPDGPVALEVGSAHEAAEAIHGAAELADTHLRRQIQNMLEGGCRPFGVSLEDVGGDQIDVGQGFITVRALLSRAAAVRGDCGGGVLVGLLALSSREASAALGGGRRRCVLLKMCDVPLLCGLSAQGFPGDFSGTFKPVPGTFRGLSAGSAGKALTALKEANALVRACFLSTR
jgi:hypothetical protein